MKRIIDKNILEATRYFITLVELGSYTAVKNAYAVELNTIKNKLMLLEEYLDMKVIQNIQNRITPTVMGMKYYHACHKLFSDIETAIYKSKHQKFNEDSIVRFLGVSVFMDIITNGVIPKLNNSTQTYILDTYSLYDPKGYRYQLSNYDVIHIATQDIDFIDIDDWIVCVNLSDRVERARIFGSPELIEKEDLNNNPKNLKNIPFIARRDALLNKKVDFKFKDQRFSLKIDQVKYIVENDTQRINMVEQGFGLAVLPEYYAEKFKGLKTITTVSDVETIIHPRDELVLVSKYCPDKKRLIDLIRHESKVILEKSYAASAIIP